MDQSKIEIKKLIENYLEGTLSKSEFDQFLAGLDQTKVSQVYTEVLRANFEKSLSKAYPNPYLVPKPKQKLTFFRNYLRLAATVILLMCVGVVALNFIRNSGGYEVNLYETATGEQLQISLPDGSEVNLNVASKLEQLSFEDKVKREVRLEGEAYFQVAKDKIHPFEISTQDINILVVGTAFNVNSYPTDNTIEVAVTEGVVKVAFTQDRKTIEQTLSKGQVLRLDKSSQNYSIKELEDAIAWRENILQFNHTEFSQVINSLERWYGADLQVADSSLFEIKITGQFKNKSLEEVIQSIGYLTNRESEINEKIKITAPQ